MTIAAHQFFHQTVHLISKFFAKTFCPLILFVDIQFTFEHRRNVFIRRLRQHGNHGLLQFIFILTNKIHASVLNLLGTMNYFKRIFARHLRHDKIFIVLMSRSYSIK